MTEQPKPQTIQREALGNFMKIGSLYNDNTKMFTSGDMFQVPPATLPLMQITSSQLDYFFEDDLKDRFNKMNVEAELKVKIMSGMEIAAEGYGRYYNFESKKSNTVRLVLQYKYLSFLEEIDYYKDLPQFAQLNHDATHFVDRILYGTIVNFLFDSDVVDENEANKIEGGLKAVFKNLNFSVEGKADVKISNEQQKVLEKVHISMRADLAPELHGETLEDVLNCINEIPAFLKGPTDKAPNDRGLAVPILCRLCPLSHFAESQQMTIDKFANQVDTGFLMDLEAALARYQQALQKLEGLKTYLDPIQAIAMDTLKEIDIKIAELHRTKQEFGKRSKKCIEILKNSQEKADLDYIQATQNWLSTNGPQCFEEFESEQMRRNGAKWQLFSYYNKLGVIILPPDHPLTTYLLIHAAKMKAVVYIYKNDDRTNNKNLFRNLKEIQSKKETTDSDSNTTNKEDKTIFIVADLDTHKTIKNTIQTPCIQIYQNRELIYRDFLKSTREELNLVERGKLEGRLNTVIAQKLKMPCPNSIKSFQDCTSKSREWICSDCLEPIYVDLSSMMAYCKHEFMLTEAKYRCSDPAHGHEFTKFQGPDSDLVQFIKMSSDGSQMKREQVYIWGTRDKYFGDLSFLSKGTAKQGLGTYVWKGKNDAYRYKMEAAWQDNKILGEPVFYGPDSKKYKGPILMNGNKLSLTGTGIYTREKEEEITWPRPDLLKEDTFFSDLEGLEFKEFQSVPQDFFLQFSYVPKTNQNGQKAKLGSNGKYYCGGTFQHIGECPCTDKQTCGPLLGCNCAGCMTLDIEVRELPAGCWVNHAGQICQGLDGEIYCGRKLSAQSNEYCEPQVRSCDDCKLLKMQIPLVYGQPLK